MALKPLTVSQLNKYLERVLHTDPLLNSVLIQGELLNVKYHSSGHVYFSISDGMSVLRCFLPESQTHVVNSLLRDGEEVIIMGKLQVYKAGGYYSLLVHSIETAGQGRMASEFEKMKHKLNEEGLFDEKHKKSISSFPKKIGIVTSETGAAVRDILKILKERNKFVEVVIFPVLVQGQRAASDISSMIDYINSSKYAKEIDTLIVGRGGGSSEDLSCFNEECVARSIYNSEIPVISAVGHEIDITIADLVADVRAATPTAAAQMAVPDINDFKLNLLKLKNKISSQVKNKIIYDTVSLTAKFERISHIIEKKIDKDLSKLNLYYAILQNTNPLSILERGYSIVEDEMGKVIGKSHDMLSGRTYNIRFTDDVVRVKVIAKEKNVE